MPPTAPANVQTALGSSASFAVSVLPSQTLSVAPLPLPAGMTFDMSTGVVSFTPQAVHGGQSLVMTWTSHEEQGEASTQTTINVSTEPVSGSTRLSGVVLTSETGSPLAGVEVSIPGTSIATTTNRQGTFSLSDIPPSARVVDIDGGATGSYAFVAEDLGLLLGHPLYPGQNNAVSRPIFLPALGPVSGTVEVDMSVDLISAAVPQVKLVITANNAVMADGTPFVGDMFLPAVTPETTPAALPETLQPGLVMAIQPAGVFFTEPAAITFPNRDNLPSGAETDIWSVNPETGVFEIAGRGRVNSAGTLIETIEGGVRAASWHFTLPAPSGPSDLSSDSDDSNGESDPGDGAGGDPGRPGGNEGDSPGPSPPEDTAPPGGGGPCGESGGDPRIGSWVDLRSGNLVVDHQLAPYVSLGQNNALRFVYNSKLAYPVPVVNIDLDFNEPFAQAPPVTSSRLSVGGINQSVETFTEGRGETFRHSAQLDATNVPSGVYPYTLRVSNHYPDSTVAIDFEGRLRVESAMQSSFGAGWTLDGLQRMHFSPGEDSVLLERGNGSSTAMVPRTQSGSGLVTDLVIVLDGVGLTSTSFDRWMNELAAVVIDSGDIWQDGTLAVSVIQAADGNAVVEIPRTLITSAAIANQLRVDIRNIEALPIASSQLAPALELAAQQVSTQDPEARKAVWLFTVAVASQGAAIQTAEEITSNGIDEIAVFASAGEAADGRRENVEFLRRIEHAGRLIRLGFSGTSVTPFVSKEIRWLVRGAPLGATSYIRENADASYTHHMRGGVRATFSPSGRMTTMLDRNGNATAYNYTGEGLLRNIVDPLGNTTTLNYVEGRLASVVDPSGKTTTFEHDGSNLTRIIDADSSSHRFEYGGSGVVSPHLMARQFDKLGNRTSQYEWNTFGSITAVEQVDGSKREVEDTVTVGLRENPGQSSLENPAFPYVLSDHKVTFTDSLNNETHYRFDKFGSPVFMRDALGRETNTTRNQDGYLVFAAFAGGGNREATYNALGDMLAYGIDGSPANLNDQKWRYEYDTKGLLTRYRPAYAGWWTFQRDLSGNLRVQADPRGVETHYFYDEAGSGVPGYTGLVTRVSTAHGEPHSEITNLEYGSTHGNVLRVEDPAGRITELGYDSSGQLQTIAQKGQQGTAPSLVTSYLRDTMGRITSITEPNGSVTEFVYDLQGNLRQVRDAKTPSGVTSYTYDAFNRVDSRTDPVDATESFQYNSEGMLTEHTDRKGQQFHYTYDIVGRLTKKEYPGNLGASGNEQVTWEHDANFDGDITNDEDYVSRITRTYPGGLKTVINNEYEPRYSWLVNTTTTGSDFQPDMRINYNRSSSGGFQGWMPKDIRYFESPTTELKHYVPEYNHLRQLEELEESAPLASRSKVIFTYDGFNRLEKRYSEKRSTRAALNTEIAYHPGGRVQTVVNEWKPGLNDPYQQVSEYTYQYDTYGRQNQKDEVRPAFGQPSHTFAYDHDATSQLIDVDRDAVALEGFTYDPVGNRLTELGATPLWNYDSANRLQNDGRYVYLYDGNGNRISKTVVGGTESTTYTWTPENFLESITKPDTSTVFYRYDGLGRRVNKQMRDTLGVLVEEHSYIFDAEDIAIVDIQRPGGTPSRVYFFHGSGFDQPCMQLVDGELEAMAMDGLGSVTEHVNMDTGVTTQAYRYSAFGKETEVLDAARPAQWGTFGFTGRERDQESDLMGYRYRQYDPTTGRFVSEDPIGFFGGHVNLYSYVSGRPLDLTDPYGLMSISPGGATMGAVCDYVLGDVINDTVNDLLPPTNSDDAAINQGIAVGITTAITVGLATGNPLVGAIVGVLTVPIVAGYDIFFD